MPTSTSPSGHAPAVRREAPDGEAYRRAMGRFPTGVAILTQGCGPLTRAVTVNSVTSVSLDPQLLSVCLGEDSTVLEPLLQAGHFTVNLLSSAQRESCARFAGRSRPTGADAHEELGGSRGDNGCLVVEGALAALECRVDGTVRAGDHVIVLGRVETLHHGPAEAEPLVFYGGGYRRLAPPAPGPR
jgi:flavin reductase (DIM6/NTAB) family NADH-FMN oxidoreductase RutF